MNASEPTPHLHDAVAMPTECCGGELHCSGDSAPGSPLSAIAPREGCPPPLQWQQVLDTFRNQSDAWNAETVAGPISGRAWGEGPTLLMLNGMSGTHELFALCAYLLKPNFRCVLMDYPQGRGITWSRLCDATAEVFDEFAGSEGGHLFGTSFGAAVALETALRLESKTRTLALQGAFAHLHLTLAERIGAAALKWCPGRISSLPLWRSLQERSHRLWFPPIDPTRWLFSLDNQGQTPIAELARQFGLLRRFDVRSRLGQWKVPTLLLHVEGEGETQSRCREELTALLPHARTEFLHTTGLLSFLTHPHRLAKVIREHISPPVS